MKKFLTRMGAGLMAVVGAVVAFGHSVKAAADTDLTAAVASGTALVNDNSSTITGFITTVWGKALVIAIILALLGLATAMIVGAIFRRRRGRK